MKITIDVRDGLMIESQGDTASDAALLANAHALGYTNVSVKIVTDADHKILIAARDAATNRLAPA